MTHDPLCPRCQHQNSRVVETRGSLAGSTRRRRLCICGFKFTTYEQVDTMPRFRGLFVALHFGRDLSS
jgi:transcriptional regulator NrdR family protein